ncbi:MAG: Holliday junction resolvase RuvX [Crocinitomicaceae bacterium]|nr:Holliday junction resolvase RuvX [Crocinitomicaceae bacterium]
MGKIIAIDFGLKRTGLALSDNEKTFAFGLETIDSKNLMDRLVKLSEKEKLDTIVLGLPKRLNNEDSHITQNVFLLKEALEKQFPFFTVELVDERFTSKMASQAIALSGGSKKQRKEKALIDKVSATIILQSYLDSIRNVY